MHHDDWRAEADRRSREHRHRSTLLTVTGPDGRPLAGARVRARLTEPDFRIGTCISAGRQVADDAAGEAYRKTILAHFDAAVCENAMKWYATEKERDVVDYSQGDATLAWCQAHGLPLRGHCLFWDKQKFAQPWVQALDAADLRRRVFARIADIAGRYRGRLSAWDVNNELLDGGFFGGRLGEGIHAEMFQAAQAADPGVPLFVNEYGILDNDEKMQRYVDLIARLRGQGAPVGGIGIQEHAAERFVGDAAAGEAERDRPERQGRGPLVIPEVWRRLDALAAAGLPIHLTEISVKTPDPVRRADCLERFLRTAHAHPAVQQFLVWGFWGGGHWLGWEATLVEPDFAPAEPMRRLIALRREWTTDVELTADAGGRIALAGWTGGYAITAAGLAGQWRLGRDTPAAGQVALSTAIAP